VGGWGGDVAQAPKNWAIVGVPKQTHMCVQVYKISVDRQMYVFLSLSTNNF